MGDISSTYQLGTVNTWTQNQPFNVWIPKSAHPVGVVAKCFGQEPYNLELVCIQSMGGDASSASRNFVAISDTQSVSGESLMFIGAVHLHKPHQHQVDVSQTMLYNVVESNGMLQGDTTTHTHTHSAMSNPEIPEIHTLLVFEVGDA